MQKFEFAELRSKWQSFERTKLYDGLAASPLLFWYGLSAAHLVPALFVKLRDVTPAGIDLFFVVSVLAQIAALVLIVLVLNLLILRPPPKAKAKGLLPRIAAVAGTYLIVAVVWLPPQPAGFALSLTSLCLILGGAGFAIFALFHLGRSFSVMPEARQLVTDGPYARIRHPLYLGEAISTLGLMLQYFSPLAVMIVALQLSFQMLRMKNEENVLSSLFPEYENYRAHTARILPGIY